MKPSLPLTIMFALTLTGGTSAIAGSKHHSHGNSSTTSASQPSTSTPDATAPAQTPVTSAAATSTAPVTSTAAPVVEPPAAIEPARLPISSPAPEPQVPLQISQTERDYFEFGYSLSKAAFGYADIAKQSVSIQKGKDHMAQIKLLAALGPAADRDRIAVRESLNTTINKMRILHAPSNAMSIVKSMADELNLPLKITGGAKDLAELSPDAGKTLASLNEFERVSGLTECPEIATWLKGRHKNRTGNVWYAEGLIAGVAEVASTQQMPELLPTVGEIATDLRGLRDWLQLRMPDPPSRQQALLGRELDDFLKTTSVTQKPNRQVTHGELVSLGSISRQLQTQVLIQTASAPSAKPVSMSVDRPTPQLVDDKSVR